MVKLLQCNPVVMGLSRINRLLHCRIRLRTINPYWWELLAPSCLSIHLFSSGVSIYYSVSILNLLLTIVIVYTNCFSLQVPGQQYNSTSKHHYIFISTSYVISHSLILMHKIFAEFSIINSVLFLFLTCLYLLKILRVPFKSRCQQKQGSSLEEVNRWLPIMLSIHLRMTQ